MNGLEFSMPPFSFDELSGEDEWDSNERESERGRRGATSRSPTQSRQRPRQPARPHPRPSPHRPRTGGSPFAPQAAAPCVCPAHRSEYVRWVQSALNRIDNAGLPVNGVVSAATRRALRAFQTRQNLPADGIAGPDTEQALRDAQKSDPSAPSTSTSEPAEPAGESEFEFGEIDEFEASNAYEFETLEFESPTSMPTLRSGSRGASVSDLQRRLGAAGFSPGGIDGIFGSRTAAAVRAFQSARHLKVDGIVGPQTWGALLDATPAPRRTPASPPTYPGTPASGLSARIAQAALQEWQRWGNGTITESDPRMRGVLEGYWRAATGAPPPAANWWEPYWSAVFISWVMRQAGAGNQFKYSSAHTEYVAAAKRNRVAGNANPFKAYRISEATPQPGDLVCAERSGSGVSYDNVDDGTFRSSHSDVVVEVNPGHVVVIGGNVSDTVGRNTISVNAAGKLMGAPYYAVLRAGS